MLLDRLQASLIQHIIIFFKRYQTLVLQMRISFVYTVLCMVFSIFSFAQNNIEDTTNFSHLVLEWNQYHNTKNIKGFEDLYASNVLFYGKYENEAKCLNTKSYFLNRMKVYEQKIVSPIITTLYTSGTVKCDFTKQVIYKQRLKEYPSYLLFQKQGNEWKITGESDLETDQTKQVQLNLGSEIINADKSSSNNPTILVLVLLLTIGGMAYFIYMKKKKRFRFANVGEIDKGGDGLVSNTVMERINNIAVDSVEKAGSDGISSAIPLSVVETNIVLPNSEDLNKQKGDSFEKMITTKFPPSNYSLLNWRSDKIHEGIYAESNMHPDLEYRVKKSNIKFAIECKYRSEFYHGGIEWAKKYQLINYKKFAKENMPVFVMIGVGGEPTNPNRLYIIPLKNISSTILKREQLHPYERLKTGDFHFDEQTMQLK